MFKILFWLYIINATLLINHEIDSAYWKEWDLFKLPGGITGFLLIHFPLLFFVMYGLVLVVQQSLAGFNWLTDYFIMPLMMTTLKIAPTAAVKPSAKIFAWSLKKFSKPPFRTILLLEASGMKSNQATKIRLTLSHEDGYFLTAVPYNT